MFLNTFEEPAEGEVDEVVNELLDSNLEAAVHQAVTACVEIIGVPQPSEDQIQEALDVIGAYTVSLKAKHSKEDKGKAKSQARYYALLHKVDISFLLEHHLITVDFCLCFSHPTTTTFFLAASPFTHIKPPRSPFPLSLEVAG